MIVLAVVFGGGAEKVFKHSSFIYHIYKFGFGFLVEEDAPRMSLYAIDIDHILIHAYRSYTIST